MKIKLYDTNHFNYATEDGRVFCRKHHKIFRLCDRRHHIDCLQCSYFFGCLQGEGVECRWDDVGNFGLYSILQGVLLGRLATLHFLFKFELFDVIFGRPPVITNREHIDY